MRKLLLISYVLFSCTMLKAQSTQVKDSLLHSLQTAGEDTSKVRLLLLIQKHYATKNFDSSLFYIRKAEGLAQKLKTDQFDFFISTAWAEYYYYNNDYQRSIAYALKNKEAAEKANDLKLLAKSYNNLSAVYNHFGQHKSAVEYILKCLDVSEKTKDSVSFPVRNLTASNTYFNLKQFDKAIVYAKKAVAYGHKFNNNFAVLTGLNNLAASYSSLNMLDSSINISKKQLVFAKQQEDVVNIMYALINICSDNFRIGDTRALNNYANEIVKYSKLLPDKQTAAEVHNVFAMKAMAQKQYSLAKTHLDSGITIALKEINADALGNLYQNYSILYYLQGKIKEGEEYSFRYDSLINAGNLRELNFYTEDLETKYETEKKEAQIQLQKTQLKQKTTLNYFLFAGAAALLVISLLGYRNYRSRQKLQQVRIDELEKEKRLAATASVLKGEEQERIRLAKDLHDGLGGMLSGIKYSLSNMKENLVMTPDNAQAFERSIDMLDGSIREMRRVAHNMMPEILIKYGLDTALKEFCSEINNSGVIHVSYHSIGVSAITIGQTTAVTVYRIVQELVNNAIKHARAENVLVQLHSTDQGKLLTVTVEDDGRGFDTVNLNQSAGMGWKNIQSRVEFLKGKIDIESEINKGTSVLIEINT